MGLRANVRKRFTFNAARAPGTSVNCGAGYHRHADKYNNKCHRIDQKHEGEGNSSHGESNKRTSPGEKSDSGGTKVVHTKEEK